MAQTEQEKLRKELDTLMATSVGRKVCVTRTLGREGLFGNIIEIPSRNEPVTGTVTDYLGWCTIRLQDDKGNSHVICVDEAMYDYFTIVPDFDDMEYLIGVMPGLWKDGLTDAVVAHIGTVLSFLLEQEKKRSK